MSLKVKEAEVVKENGVPVPPFKYIHLRYHFKQDESKLNPDGIWSNGGATIVYQLFPNRLVFSFALCSRSDLFNKERGRRIGEGRIKKGHHSEFPITPEADLGKLFNDTIKPKVLECVDAENKWELEGWTTLTQQDGSRAFGELADHLY